MLRLKATLKTGFISIIISLLPVAVPLTVYAATSPDETSSECTPPPASDPHSQGPNGSAAATFHYNCTTQLWENSHYTYDPISHVTSSKDPVVYTYNNSTGLWDFITWIFNAPSGAYVARTSSVSQAPAGAVTVGGPAPAVSSSGSSSGSDGSVAQAGQATAAAATNTAQSVANDISATATSGNTSVYGNTTAGNATSGNATTMANIMNLLQSSGSLNSGQVATFTQTINGDVTGDILLDPAQLSLLQPASSDSSLNGKLQLNNQTDSGINNNINLAATSGGSIVARNTTAGNATTGNASAVANIINIINSVVSSGKSFVGTININGNLNGDILLPPNFIDQLLASNVPTTTINTVQISGNNQAIANITNNQAINNNVSATATSGQATVDRNTTAGNATSGNTSSNITVFNLTGSQIIGKNSLLVFVNVLGKWVGMIVNAPGATAAELGGGISNSQLTTNSTIGSTNNASINNNVVVAARSGDATVSENTTAGSAVSGTAQAAVNLLNVANGSMSLSDWFGILFINVFGSWNGSFGVDTSAGNPSTPGTSGPGASVQVFRFVSHPASGGRTQTVRIGGNASVAGPTVTTTSQPPSRPVVLASATTSPPSSMAQLRRSNSSWLLSAMGSGLLGATFLAAEKTNKRRQKPTPARLQHKSLR